MKLPKVTNFPAEYRDIVIRLADSSTGAKRRTIRCVSDKEAKSMQWHFYRFMTACDQAKDEDLPFSRATLRAFRQCYALKVERAELVFLPRSDSPRAKAANTFLMDLMQEDGMVGLPGIGEDYADDTIKDPTEGPAVAPGGPMADAAPSPLFAPSGRYAAQEPPPKPVEPPPQQQPPAQPIEPSMAINPAWLAHLTGDDKK